MDYTLAKECKNEEVWYTCYKCGKCGRYIEKLETKIANKSNTTLSERVCQVMNLYLEDIQREIFDTKKYIEATNKENGDAI